MIAELDRDAAQDQQPQHDHQRQIEAAEAGGIERGEGEVERAAGGEQPDFVAVPDGADGAQHGRRRSSSVCATRRWTTPAPRSKPSSTT